MYILYLFSVQVWTEKYELWCAKEVLNRMRASGEAGVDCILAALHQLDLKHEVVEFDVSFSRQQIFRWLFAA